jgi:hypothetical protein
MRATELDPKSLLERYDAQLRTALPERLPEGASVERDGPLLRLRGFGGGGQLVYRDLDGLSGAALDALIARQCALSREHREPLEWKLHGHDEPADLPARLAAAGFAPEARETIVVGAVAGLAAVALAPPPGIRLREVTSRADLERIAALQEAVWAERSDWLPDMLGGEIAADPRAIAVCVAEVQGGGVAPGDDGFGMVSAGWLRFVNGTAFSTLWGGATLPAYRARGIYTALVARRARLAAQRGTTLLQVDASDDSRPILERLGFVALTTTTPWVFAP